MAKKKKKHRHQEPRYGTGGGRKKSVSPQKVEKKDGPCHLILTKVVSSPISTQASDIALVHPTVLMSYGISFAEKVILVAEASNVVGASKATITERREVPIILGLFHIIPSSRVSPGKARVQLHLVSSKRLKIGMRITVQQIPSPPISAAKLLLKELDTFVESEVDLQKGMTIKAVKLYINSSLSGHVIGKESILSLPFGGQIRHLEVVDIVPRASSNRLMSRLRVIRSTTDVSLLGKQVDQREVPQEDIKGKKNTGDSKQGDKKEVLIEDTQESKEVGYSGIGGLEKEIRMVREIISAPLKTSKLFKNLGLRAPKGVLLYGPPGTGKTMVSRAVAREIGASFFTINSPEIVGQYVGEAEQRLNEIFQKASLRAPSVVFFDEIDAICPSRDKATSPHSQRLVACLLTLLDGIQSDDRVAVIAATNRPNALDPALRRPGRLDREIHLGVPNMESRVDILNRIMKPMPTDLKESEIRECAKIAHGFVGADLRLLCQEAAFASIKRLRQKNSLSKEAAQISFSDFKIAFQKVKPSAMRAVMIDVPNVKWTDIGGQHVAKARLREAVDWPLRHPEAFKRMGIRAPRGVLLYGPPGNSKTLMAKALATESSRNFIAVKGPELFSMWVGESERAVRTLFTTARAAAPSIVFFDEIDALAARRGSGGQGGGARARERVLGQLLSELDGMQELSKVVVIAATNRPDRLDPAITRPGRIDRMLYVGPPDHKSRCEIATIQLKRMAHAESVSSAYIADATSGYSGAEVCAICQRAASLAMEEDIKCEQVEKRHIDMALRSFGKPRIDSKTIKWYEAFESGLRGNLN